MILDLKHLPLPQFATVWPLVVGLGVILILLRSFYRLFLHPLSHIPGPKLAAISRGYEFYHDVIRKGMYIWEIEKMHEQYGPVVRISPREIHVKDPYFYDEVYAPSSRMREKDRDFVGGFGLPTSMAATLGHELHRLRRGILNNFFSKKSVMALSPIILAKQAKLRQRLEDIHYSDGVVRLDDAYAALTGDIIAQYSWSTSPGFLDDKNFRNDIHEAFNELTSLIHINRFFPILASTPRWFQGVLRPGAIVLGEMQEMVTRSSAQKSREGAQKTIFDALSDPAVPLHERSAGRLKDEGMVVLFGGTETTARVLTVISYHIFQNRPLLLKLRDEIRTMMPTPTTEPSWSELERLPYLNATINEGLRLSHSPIFRSTRVAPTESFTYKNLVIPPGTPISICAYFVHMDPKIFPEPETFKPERWIEAAEKGQHLNKFIVAFSKGSRVCLGMNLAYAELYMTLATIIRRFDVELYETGPDNIRIDREIGIGVPKQGEFKVQAKITKIITE
ncbi:cytochrome P450 [Hypoxylon cercidicola]|nr:cytochrome P450 [Hypoxylon cercidicola]